MEHNNSKHAFSCRPGIAVLTDLGHSIPSIGGARSLSQKQAQARAWVHAFQRGMIEAVGILGRALKMVLGVMSRYELVDTVVVFLRALVEVMGWLF